MAAILGRRDYSDTNFWCGSNNETEFESDLDLLAQGQGGDEVNITDAVRRIQNAGKHYQRT